MATSYKTVKIHSQLAQTLRYVFSNETVPNPKEISLAFCRALMDFPNPDFHLSVFIAGQPETGNHPSPSL